MKYTKSAIGLLTREYRSVLKKCLLINLGLFALGAVSVANAETITERTVIGTGTERTFSNATASDLSTEEFAGSVIYNEGTTTIENSIFSGNRANGAGGQVAANDYRVLGGAVYNKGTMTITGGTFTNNQANGGTATRYEGGAIFNKGTLDVSGTFGGENATDGNKAYYGGAIYNRTGTLNIAAGTIFRNNAATGATKSTGGAVYNDSAGINSIDSRLQDGTNPSILNVGDGVIFDHNTATWSASALWSEGTAARDATEVHIGNNVKFTNNTSDGRSGALAVYGNNILTVGENAEFSNNTAAIGAAISLNADDEGSGYTTATVGAGALFQNNYAKGTVRGKGGAIAIEESGNKLTLTDATFTNNKADVSGGAVYNEGDVTIKAENADVTFSGNTANGEANDIYNKGSLALTAAINHYISLGGGITGDASAKGTVNIGGEGYTKVANTLQNQNVSVASGATLQLDGADLTGTTIGGTGDVKVIGDSEMKGDNVINKDIAIEKGQKLEITGASEDDRANITGTGDLNNAEGGLLKITNGDIHVGINNYGTLISDPTHYYDTVTNNAGAYASFDADVFETSATLANSGNVDLKNSVSFLGDAAITGTGVTNLVSGTTAFNNTANSNTIKLAGGDFGGTINGGTVDMRDGTIQTGDGRAVSAGTNLYVDANLNNGSMDAVSGTINKINVSNTAYGDAASVELTGTFANDVEVEGFSYYTDIQKTASKITFSDKLVNQTGMENYVGKRAAGEEAATGLFLAVDTLNGDANTTGSVDKKISDAIGHAATTEPASEATGLYTTFLTQTDAASTYQTKIDADHKLAASNVSGLATVATSGSYNDLLNKPTLGTASAAELVDEITNTSTDAQVASAKATRLYVNARNTELTNTVNTLSNSVTSLSNDVTEKLGDVNTALAGIPTQISTQVGTATAGKFDKADIIKSSYDPASDEPAPTDTNVYSAAKTDALLTAAATAAAGTYLAQDNIYKTTSAAAPATDVADNYVYSVKKADATFATQAAMNSALTGLTKTTITQALQETTPIANQFVISNGLEGADAVSSTFYDKTGVENYVANNHQDISGKLDNNRLGFDLTANVDTPEENKYQTVASYITAQDYATNTALGGKVNSSDLGFNIVAAAEVNHADNKYASVKDYVDSNDADTTYTAGNGIAISGANAISVKTGSGVMIDADGKVALNKVATNSGLAYDTNGAVKVDGLTNDHIASGANIALSKLATTDLSQFNNATSNFQSATQVAAAISNSIVMAPEDPETWQYMKSVLSNPALQENAVSVGALGKFINEVGFNMQQDQLGWNINVAPSDANSFSKTLGSIDSDDFYDSLTETNRTVVGALNKVGNAIETLNGTGAGSVAKSIHDNAKDAVYIAGTGGAADITIGEAIAANTAKFGDLGTHASGSETVDNTVEYALGLKADAEHTHAASDITAMTGYSKASAASAIAAGDSLNTAIGKLEYKADANTSKFTTLATAKEAEAAAMVHGSQIAAGTVAKAALATDLSNEITTSTNKLAGDWKIGDTTYTTVQAYVDAADTNTLNSAKSYTEGFLEAKTGGYKTVAESVDAHIAALNLADTYAAKSLETDFNSGGASSYSANALYNKIHGDVADSYSLMFNEVDGGGSQYYNKTTNEMVYVGTHGTGSNTWVKLYAIDNTSKDGSRMWVKKGGIFYSKNSTNTYTANDEIVTLATAKDGIYGDTTIGAAITANTSAIDTLNGDASTTGSVAKSIADAIIANTAGTFTPNPDKSVNQNIEDWVTPNAAKFATVGQTFTVFNYKLNEFYNDLYTGDNKFSGNYSFGTWTPGANPTDDPTFTENAYIKNTGAAKFSSLQFSTGLGAPVVNAIDTAVVTNELDAPDGQEKIIATKATVQAALNNPNQDIVADDITAHSATISKSDDAGGAAAGITALSVTATDTDAAAETPAPKTTTFVVNSNGITAEGNTSVRDGNFSVVKSGDTDETLFSVNGTNGNVTAGNVTANSVTLGANSVSAISSDMINSTNHNATTIATTEAVYKALGKVDHLITESGDYRVFDGDQGEGMVALSSNNVVNGHYYGNLATGTEVARDLVSLDNAVGNLNFKAITATGEGEIPTNYLNGVPTVSGALVTLDSTIKGVVDDVTLAWTKAYNWSSYVLGVNPVETKETQLQTSLNALGAAAPTGDGKGNNIEATSIAGALHELDVEKAGLATANQFTNTNDFTQGLKVSNGTVTTADGYAASTLTATADGLNISTGAKVNGVLTATGDITAPNVTGTTSVITPKLTLNGKDLTASSYEANLVTVTPYVATDTAPTITIAAGDNATVTTTKTLSDSLTGVVAYAGEVFKQKQDWMSQEFGYDTNTTDANTVLGADGAKYADQNGDGKVGFADALIQLNGADTLAGSVKNSIKTLAESANYTPDATAVNTASAGTINAAILANDKAIGNRASLGSLNAAINTGTATSVAAGMKAAGDAIGDMNFASAKIEALRDDTNLSEAIRTLDGYLNIDTGLWNNISSLKDPDANPRTTATNVGKAIQYLGLYVDSKRLDVANDGKTATIYDDKIDSSNKATFYTTTGAEAKFYAKDEQLDGSQIASGSIAEGSLATAVVNKLTKAENSVQGIKDGGQDFVTLDADKKLVISKVAMANLADDVKATSIADGGTGFTTSDQVYDAVSGKQDALTATNGIKIEKVGANTNISVKLAATNSGLVADENGLKVSGLTNANIDADAEIAQSKIAGLTDALAGKIGTDTFVAYGTDLDTTKNQIYTAASIKGALDKAGTAIQGIAVQKGDAIAVSVDDTTKVATVTYTDADTTYTAGNGVSIDTTNNNAIAVKLATNSGLAVDEAGLKVSGLTDDHIASVSQSKVTGLADALDAKQAALTEGNGIAISSTNAISVNYGDGLGVDNAGKLIVSGITDDNVSAISQSKITGLSDALAAKADTSLSNITDAGKTVINNQIASKVVSYTAGATTAPDADKIYSAASIQGSLDLANTALQAGDDATLGDVTADKLVLKGATGATDQELTAAKVASYDGYDSRITANTNRFDGFASDTQTVAQYVTANAKDATYDATHTIEQAIATKADASSLNDYMLLADYTTGAAKDLDGAKLATESVAEGALEQAVQDKLAKADTAVQNGDASLTLGTGAGAEELTAAKIAQITTNAGLLAGMGDGQTVVSYVSANAVNGTYNPNAEYTAGTIGKALQGKADADSVILKTAMVQTLPAKADLVAADADKVASVTAIANALADKVDTDDVLDSVVASPAAGKIYNAATVNSELAKKFNTDDIVTTVAASATASDTKVASEKAVRTELDKKLDAELLDAYKVKNVDADGTILLDSETGKIKVGTIGLSNIKADAFGAIVENGTTLVKSGTIYTYFQDYAKLGQAANFSSLTLGSGSGLQQATAISDGTALSLDNPSAADATTLATNLTVVNTINAALAAGESIEGKDHYWTGDNVFKKNVTFQDGITVIGTTDTQNLKIGDATVSSIDKGTTAVAVGAGDPTKLATTATVMKSAENATFTAPTGDAAVASLGSAATIHNAIVNVGTVVDTNTQKIGNMTFTGTNVDATNTNNLTSAVNQLDAAIGNIGTITAAYAQNANGNPLSNVSEAINNVALAAAQADGSLVFTNAYTTSEGTATGTQATNLTDAINNVAKNAEAAIAGAVSDVRAEIHGDTGDHKEVKLGDLAETVIVGKSYVNSAAETVITDGIGIDTKEHTVDLVALDDDENGAAISLDGNGQSIELVAATDDEKQQTGMEIDNKNQKVTISSNDTDTNKGASIKLDNKNGKIELNVTDASEDIASGLTIDNGNQNILLASTDQDEKVTTGVEISNESGTRTVTIGTKDEANNIFYTVEVDGEAGKTTIGDGTDEVVIGKGDITADKSVTVGDMTDKGVKLDATDGSITTTGKANIGDKLTVAAGGADITGDTTIKGALYAGANGTEFQVGSTGNVYADGSINSKKDVVADGKVQGNTFTNTNGSFQVGSTGHVYAQALAFNSDQNVKVNAIDTGATAVTGDGSAETMATTATVMTSAENAKYTNNGTGVVKAKNVATLHDAIQVLDNAMGTMDLSSSTTTTFEKTAATDTEPATFVDNATDALLAIDTVVGNVKALDGTAKGNLDGANKSVAEHLAKLDNRLGSIKAIDGGANGNLAVADSDVATHFNSLDVAMGNRTNYKNNSGSNGYVATNDGSKDLTTMISEVASNIGTASDIRSTNQISANQTVNANLSALDTALGNVADLQELGYGNVTEAIIGTNEVFSKAINQLDMNYRDLRHDFEAGMAGQAALSALVPNGRARGDTQLSVGTGMYKGHTAAAVGGFHWLTDNLLFNAGVAWDNAEATGRLGVTYSW
jgi:predicted outer membrane repeat protein